MYSIIIKQSSFAVLSHAKIIQWASQDIKMRTETVRQDGLRGKKNTAIYRNRKGHLEVLQELRCLTQSLLTINRN